MIDENIAKLTVGIPTFNSSKYLEKCIKSVINVDCVSEIIISDDCSSKLEKSKIIKIVNKFKKYNKNILLEFNNENFGAYVNKFNLLQKSNNELVYILDSDNIAMKKLDEIFNFIISTDNYKNFLFLPNTLYQFRRFPKFKRIYSLLFNKSKVKFVNKTRNLTFNDVRDSMILNPGSYDLKDYSKNINELEANLESDFMVDKWIMWVLNCGNFIVSKKSMLNIGSKGINFERKLRSTDAVVFSYLWLMSGKSIKIISNFYHHHRKRNDSVSFLEREASQLAINHFISEIIN